MTKLYEKFVCTVASVENKDASNYRVYRLKEKLKDDYPQLVFFTPSKRNKTEIVYCEFIDAGELIEEKMEEENTEDEGSQDEDDEDHEEEDREEIKTQANFTTETDLLVLYRAAMLLKGIIAEAPLFDAPWPPTSFDINLENAKKIVPIALYNFLAWVLRKSDVPDLSNYVIVPDQQDAKLLSLAQDLIYVASNGKKSTP